ncbi:hypothetical protein ACT009_05830 [Sphingomonas sp. Tas61C01]|uniref:hypothetical protein n=1 Tax=Sphingomonas sp. Tas61C01 TaxID=3458297 RepID=UPI00403EB0DB
MTDTKSADTASHGKLDQTIDAAERAYGRTVDTASQTIDASPLGILAGGLALGALAGALLPRSDKEKELLAPVGKHLGERVRAATQAARTAGQEEFANLGLTKDGAKDQVKTLLEGVTKALSTAGAAAAKSASSKA